MSENPQKREELDNTLEDAFGVNFRALRTLKDLLVRPSVVFASYAANDRVTYTPSIRLFVGLIAVQVFVSFLWGGYGGLLISQWEAQPGTIPQMEGLFNAPIADVAEHYGNAATLLHAILVGSFTALSAFLIGTFNKSLGWVSRLNINFAILTGGTVVGLLGLMLAAVTGLMAVVNWMPLIVFASYWIFFVRGAKGVVTTTMAGTVVKGGIYAAVTMIYVILGGIVMAIIALSYAYFRINGGG